MSHLYLPREWVHFYISTTLVCKISLKSSKLLMGNDSFWTTDSSCLSFTIHQKIAKVLACYTGIAFGLVCKFSWRWAVNCLNLRLFFPAAGGSSESVSPMLTTGLFCIPHPTTSLSQCSEEHSHRGYALHHHRLGRDRAPSTVKGNPRKINRH